MSLPIKAGRFGVQRVEDLNTALIYNGNEKPTPIEDNGIQVGPVSVHFRNLAEHLEEFILNSDCIVGCVAWFTHPHVLAALSHCECVSIVLNKEDFLRPDSLTQSGRDLQEAIGKLTGIRRHRHEPVSTLCFADSDQTEPMRCLGLKGRGNHPRLHHKFLVRVMRGYRRWEYIPTAVWTGSFNPTRNGAASLENAVVIRSRKIAEAYYWEWGQALALSEPLDWHSPWIAPEYRIGS